MTVKSCSVWSSFTEQSLDQPPPDSWALARPSSLFPWQIPTNHIDPLNRLSYNNCICRAFKGFTPGNFSREGIHGIRVWVRGLLSMDLMSIVSRLSCHRLCIQTFITNGRRLGTRRQCELKFELTVMRLDTSSMTRWYKICGARCVPLNVPARLTGSLPSMVDASPQVLSKRRPHRERTSGKNGTQKLQCRFSTKQLSTQTQRISNPRWRVLGFHYEAHDRHH